ncbi:phosphatase PAP2 family protein [Cohnella sp. CFH 77786]|uniref:phosphatase PAP2 family protein n=1 Tax=Cohnella sp. CFH 77786 TaxID=2662265 RepID=UPI001C60BA48|nr:phosphatase PAP2 family protein [Cohnella sp. CFH 77786]MBW5447895.1 phosphatase PAP2 family protein [Cohnella sp. CFH 77786]
MTVFTSLQSVQAWTAATIAILLWFGTGRQPLDPVYRLLRSLAVSRKCLLFFLAALGILVLNTFEVKLENAYGVSYDLTAAMTGWEGNWHVWLQSRLSSGLLTAVCAFFYVVVFQSVMISSLGIYASQSGKRLYYAFCVALLVNYAVALPMYWFVPVNEAWYADPRIHFLMLDAFPTFERDYRGLSGINNCFPSLHTSISVTMALLAARSGIRRWAVFAWINAAVIVFAIFYLGIHWFTDAIAGVLLAMFSVYVGMIAGARAERSASSDPLYKTADKKAFPTG